MTFWLCGRFHGSRHLSRLPGDSGNLRSTKEPQRTIKNTLIPMVNQLTLATTAAPGICRTFMVNDDFDKNALSYWF
jgi:hypothetical protein